MWLIAYYVIMALLVAYTFIMARKGQKSTLTAGTLDATTADEGASIPVVFGTCDVSPNCVAFQAGAPQPIKKKA